MSVSQRYLEMDALRGFAVMGILAINIVAFAQPEMAYVNPVVSSQASDMDIFSWAIHFMLFDGKMRGLFSLLFGASTALVIERAAAGGQSIAKVHFSRMAWLAVFGLVHFFFIWFGDILFLYAVSGAVLFLFRNWSAQRLIRWGVIAYALGAILLIVGMSSMLFLLHQAGQANPPQEILDDLANLYAELGVSPDEVAAETSRYLGGYAELLHFKLTEQSSLLLNNLVLGPIETIPLMMIGMGLYKNGFLLGRESRETYIRTGRLMMAIGLPFFVLLVVIAYVQDFNDIWMMNVSQAWSMLPRLFMIIGYVALFILIIQRFKHTPLLLRVAAAGRAAFSNYLGTSILMTFIFYGWGLGYFEQFGRFQLQLFVLGTWALMLLWSKPWLMRFRYGPLEWLWRSLAKGQAQPMQIQVATS